MTMTTEEELEAAREQIKELEDAVHQEELNVARLETQLEEKRCSPFDFQAFQLRHQKLLTGDLSRLTHADRRELFEAIYDFDSIALSRIENHI